MEESRRTAAHSLHAVAALAGRIDSVQKNFAGTGVGSTCSQSVGVARSVLATDHDAALCHEAMKPQDRRYWKQKSTCVVRQRKGSRDGFDLTVHTGVRVCGARVIRGADNNRVWGRSTGWGGGGSGVDSAHRFGRRRRRRR